MRKILIAAAASLLLCGCSLFTSFTQSDEESAASQVTGISLGSADISLDKGDSDYLSFSIEPSDVQNKVSVAWKYDESIISIDADKNGAVVTGLAEGKTYIKGTVNNITAACLVTVSADGSVTASTPYIYSDFSVIEMQPGDTKTVTVSLYGGTSTDLENFTWSVSDSSVAEISSSARNNCIVKAKKTGSCQLVASHPKACDADTGASYPYTMVIFVYDTEMTETYITTDMNVIGIDKNSDSSVTASVDLVNPVAGTSGTYQNGFSWSVYSGADVVSINPNGKDCIITPLKAGVAYIDVSHENAEYPLRIIVRVVALVSNTYIVADSSNVVVEGSSTTCSVTCSVYQDGSPYSGIVDDSGWTWSACLLDTSTKAFSAYTSLDPSSSSCDSSIYGSIASHMSWQSSGGVFYITGLRDGVVKVKVGHELSSVCRTFIVVLSNQTLSATDSTAYITTSQNYVLLQCAASGATAEAVEVDVSYVGGTEGEDESGFHWFIDGGPKASGTCSYTSNPYIDMVTQTGDIQDSSLKASRTAATSGTSCTGRIYLTPKAPGTCTITIQHDDVLYDCQVIVKVLSAYAYTEDPITVGVTPSSLDILNGASGTLSATLTNPPASDSTQVDNVSWSASDSALSLTPSSGASSGASCIVTAPASGTAAGHAYVTASYSQTVGGTSYSSSNTKKVLVRYGDTAAAISSQKCIYSPDLYLRINKGSSGTLTLNEDGFTEGEFNASAVTWSVADSSTCSIGTPAYDFSTGACTVTVSGTSCGRTYVHAVYGTDDVSFEVTVLAEGESTGVNTDKYLSTDLNAVVMESDGDSVTVSVTGSDMTSSELRGNVWSFVSPSDRSTDDSSSAAKLVNMSVNSSGCSATLSPVDADSSTGKTCLRITNPASNNSLYIDVKVGSYYEWTDGTISYITTSVNDEVTDTLSLVSGNSAIITAGCVNCDTYSFSFAVTDGSDLLSITKQLSNGVCQVKALAAGVATVTVTNASCTVPSKEFLVVISNTAEEAASVRYLTTSSNVVTVYEGGNTTVSVSIKNCSSTVLDGYEWESSDPTVCSVVSSGSTAVIYGLKAGTAKISVSNDANTNGYSLEIIATCVDPTTAAANPYITLPNIVILTVGDGAQTVTADLVGGSESDYVNFSWAGGSSSVCTMYPSNEVCRLTPVAEGYTQITVSHPKAAVSRTLLVVCEPASTTDCYITTTESIIKMTPEDADTTITATLVNGDADDIYNFKWWADDYSIIDMDYAQNQCVITPLATGKVTIHCSHPKASSEKDIIIYISQYDEFAFPDAYVELAAGSTTMEEAEVPVTGVSTYVSFSSNDPTVCTVTGSSGDVCVIRGVKAGSTTVTAKLLASSNDAVQATAKIAVNVTAAAASGTYLCYSGDTIIKTAKSQTIKLGTGDNAITLAGTCADSSLGDGAGYDDCIYYEVTDTSSLSVIGATTTETSNYGLVAGSTSADKTYHASTLTLKSMAAGKTTCIKVYTSGLSTEAQPIYIYVKSSGTASATVVLSKSKISTTQNSSPQSVTATLSNPADGDYEGLEWWIVPEVYYTSSGAKYSCSVDSSGNISNASAGFDPSWIVANLTYTSGISNIVTPVSVGTCMLFAKVPSSGAIASCTVIVDYENLLTLSCSTLLIQPSSKGVITYTTNPLGESVEWTFSDESRIVWSDDKYSVNSSSKVGILTISADSDTTYKTITVTGTTSTGLKASCKITLGYDWYFEVDKSSIVSTPALCRADANKGTASGILTIHYTIRPAAASVRVYNLGANQNSSDLKLKNLSCDSTGSASTPFSAASDSTTGGYIYTYSSHTDPVQADGTTGGYITMACSGQCAGTISIKAFYGSSQVCSTRSVTAKVYYTTYNIGLYSSASKSSYGISRGANTHAGTKSRTGIYSYYNSYTNSLFLGDGELVTFYPALKEDASCPLDLTAVSFTYKNGTAEKTAASAGLSFSSSKEYDAAKSLGSSNLAALAAAVTVTPVAQADLAGPVVLYSGNDLGDGLDTSYSSAYMADIVNKEYAKWLADTGDDSLVKSLLAGYVTFSYVDYISGSTSAAKIPVYLMVRNNLCDGGAADAD